MTTALEATPTLCCSSDFEPDFTLEHKDAATGALVPSAGLSGVSYWLSATLGGDAVHSDLSQPATERSAAPGDYSATFDTVDMLAHLQPHFDQAIWLVISLSGDILHSYRYICRQYCEG